MSKAEREEHTWFGLYLWETGKEKECKRLLTRLGRF